MKKILYITTIGGFLSQFEKNDVKLMLELGYEVHYASNFRNPVYAYDREELEAQGIVLHQIDIAKSPLKIATNIRAINQLKNIIDKEQIDMVHCHNPMGGVAGRVAAHVSRKKPYVIYTAHGLHFYKRAPLLNWVLFYPVEKWLARWTDIIITINREDYQRVKNQFCLKPNGFVAQIPGVGVDLKRFCPRPEQESGKRKELEIPEHAFHIVTVAELNNNKNQKVIIEAIAQLGRKDIYYSICGSGPNEPNLRRLIADKQLDNQVRLLGYRADIDEILQTADVFAFPSVREGLGLAALEALACAVPLIVADNRGSREYAVNGVNSLVCKADDVEDFKEAIAQLYGDLEFRMRLSNQSRESVVKFSVEEQMEIMRDVYGKANQQIS